MLSLIMIKMIKLRYVNQHRMTELRSDYVSLLISVVGIRDFLNQLSKSFSSAISYTLTVNYHYQVPPPPTDINKLGFLLLVSYVIYVLYVQLKRTAYAIKCDS